MSFLDHVAEVFVQERDVFFYGLVRSPFQGRDFLPFGPRLGVHHHGHPVFLVVRQEMTGFVQD